MSVTMMLMGYVLVSAMSFLLFAADKQAARTGGWRISERRLLLASALGGWPGGVLAMRLLRHKTLRVAFRAAHNRAGLAHLAVMVSVSGWLYFPRLPV